MTLKKTLTGLLLLGGLLTCGAALAYTNACTPTNTTVVQAQLGNIGIPDPADDMAGYEKDNAASWNLSQGGTATCDCAPNTAAANFFSAVPYGTPDGSSGSNNFYVVNEYLSVASQIYIAGAVKKYEYTPFDHFSNQSTATKNCQQNNYSFASGAQGKLSIKIRKPFVGSTYLNNFKAIDMYASKDTTAALTTPYMSVYLNGSVTVPQNCVINAGTQVTVDLGEIYSGDMATAGQKPEGYTPKSFNVPIQCNNMDASANLTLRVQGTPASGNPQALQSDNADVGVVITDNSGNVLTPNDNTSVVPFQTDDSNNANVTLQTYPVNTSGNTPAEGLFTTLAYLRIDFA